MWWPTYEPLRDLVECQLGCEVVPIRRDPAAGWAAPADELGKLLDPRVRLAITVSPGNPVPVVTDPGSLDGLERAVAERPELLVLSDYVYTHFLDEPVETEIGRLPRNTIGVYSVKDFGLAGMRLGVVLIHPECVAERALCDLRADGRGVADDRYRRRALEPREMPLGERIVADSRGVSFTHMSGLSTPLQGVGAPGASRTRRGALHGPRPARAGVGRGAKQPLQHDHRPVRGGAGARRRGTCALADES